MRKRKRGLKFVMGNVNRSGARLKLVDTSEYKLRWVIPNFFKMCPKNSTKFVIFKSPPFTAGEIHRKPIRWFLAVRKREDKLTLCLILESSKWKWILFVIDPLEFIQFTAQIGITCDPQRPFYFAHLNDNTKIFLPESHSGNDVWVWANFISMAELYRKKEEFHRNDPEVKVSNKLHVTLHLKICNKGQGVNGSISKLSSNIQEFCNSPKYSDVVIRCHDEIFYCHKIILAAQSPVLQNIIDQQIPLTTGVPSEIVINDFEPIVIKNMLKYIYGGKFQKIESCSWTELIRAAEKYELKELQHFCMDSRSRLPHMWSLTSHFTQSNEMN